MKIQAKDIKVGMTITTKKQRSTVSIKVDEIVYGSLKNGNRTVTVFGKSQLKSSDRPVFNIERYELVIRENTFVNI